MNPMVTTNQNLTIDIQKWRGKEHKHSTKGNHQTAREEAKRENERRTTETTRKQVIKIVINIYLPIITLNINGIKGPNKRRD